MIQRYEDVGTKNFNDFKGFSEYSNDFVDIHKNIEEYNPNKNRKILIVNSFFDNAIAGMLNNKKLNPIVTELLFRGKKTRHFSCFYYTILFSCANRY